MRLPRSRVSIWLSISLFLLPSTGFSRQDFALCGTRPDRLLEEQFLHQRSLDRSGRQAVRLLSGGSSQGGVNRAAAVDAGDIAILGNGDGVVSVRNPFDLENRTVTFTPVSNSAGRYTFAVTQGGYDEAAAAAGTLIGGFGDDDSRSYVLPFPFRFFGESFSSVFVNSDGNLTFLEADTATSERSLGRVTTGPPRIAGVFRDLDPSNSRSEGVRVLAEPGRFVVSFVNVAEYTDFSFAPLVTFQMRLYPDGRIAISYGAVQSVSLVSGISPGRLRPPTAVVHFSAGSSAEYAGTVAERFGSTEELDLTLAAQKFYETHDDAYDYLVFYNNSGLPASASSVAFEITVRNIDRSGFGDMPVDAGAQYGSARRLQAVLNMGPLSQYPLNPDAPVPARGFTGDTALSVLAHEVGHLFLAFASVEDEDNPDNKPMLGRAQAHWAFTFNSEASFLEGNRIADRGLAASPRFLTTDTVQQYAPLDQYLMGFRAPDETPPTFLVARASVSATRAPQSGVPFNGTRREVRVEDLIAAEGPRIPDHTVAQRRFRAAVILVVKAGTEPPQTDLQQLDTYRRRLEDYYFQATGGRAEIRTNLVRSLALSTEPASGVLQGRFATATVSVAQPVTAALTVLLRAESPVGGVVSLPRSVLIPAGETSATFQFGGITPGVAEIFAEAADPAFSTASSRIQVLAPGGAGLRMEVVSGSGQASNGVDPLADPVVVRVIDANNLPYPGLPVDVKDPEGGAVHPQTAQTDPLGRFIVQWTPVAAERNELSFSVPGLSGVTATATAAGPPSVGQGGVTNAASFVAGLSPGGLATLFGLNLTASAPATAPSLPLPVELGNTRINVGGAPAGLFYVSDRQINFLVPDTVTGPSVRIQVQSPAGVSADVVVPVYSIQPGIFFETSTGFGAVLIAGTGETASQRPAVSGDVLEVYATGLGRLTASTRYPGLQETALPVSATIDGIPAEVLFAGGAPGFAGLNQVNVRVPAGLAPGIAALQISAGGAASNPVKISIR